MKENIWRNLLTSENKARASRLNRFLINPFLYTSLLTYSYLLFPFFKKNVYATALPFYGIKMKTLLPSGTDILLNGIKSHDSEIRLSKFLTLTLNRGEVFIDVGAHHGYYSQLASVLTGPNGTVYSIEPSGVSFALLQENTLSHKNIMIYNAAAGNQNRQLTFYEYPGPYSEYNTTVKDAYINAGWAKNIQPTVTTVDTIILDKLLKTENIEYSFIKIDVEGGEPEVLEGMRVALAAQKHTIIMEYLLSKNESTSHRHAANILYESGYFSNVIKANGALERTESIENYMKATGRDSDNIVFTK